MTREQAIEQAARLANKSGLSFTVARQGRFDWVVVGATCFLTQVYPCMLSVSPDRSIRRVS